MSTIRAPRKRILIVGGVAGGASCAARLRRLDEHAEIIIFDRGPFVSFANCGLPYYIGGVIKEESSLVLASPKLFKDRFDISVHTGTEVLSIDSHKQEITVRDVASGVRHMEPYDALVLSPGSAPVRPALPGIDLPGIFTLRSIPDSTAIKAWVETRRSMKAVVVGGGFIGLEMAENLIHAGLKVTVVEMLDQVLPPLDKEIAEMVADHLRSKGVEVALGNGVAGFDADSSGGVKVHTQRGISHDADVVIFAVGVRPETALAKTAGIKLGARGGIRVNESMQTSDPHIWAVGDAIEVKDWVTGQDTLIPLAGPANRQGRIAADAICGRNSKFRGVQGTAICGLFGLQVASTGASEKALIKAGVHDFEKVYLYPSQHVGYYPGAKKIHLKLLFRKSDGLILGAQGVGEEGVDRRIDVIAMAMQKNGTVYDLEEAELCYAPQFGAAKDPVNFAGMVASDVLREDMPIVHWTDPVTNETVFLDVRDPDEFDERHHEGAINIPVNQLRAKLTSVPRDKDLRVYCAVGQRGYLATRLLAQHGIKARNLSGGLSSKSRA